MNRENLENHWEEISSKLVNRFTKLTSIDVAFVKGQEEQLLKRIETRLNKSRLDILNLIASL